MFAYTFSFILSCLMSFFFGFTIGKLRRRVENIEKQLKRIEKYLNI